jgi:YgiT-type zinc finger domain-containing protein
MICLICRQVATMDGFTSVTFERGEMKFVFNNVPARVCPHCGEAYVEEVVAERLLMGAEEMSRMGELEDVRDYELL